MLGYSSRSDTAVQYAVERTENQFNPVVQLWSVEVFDRKPLRAGYWKFTWEAGHGESEWIDEEVHFDAARQLFVEKMTTRPYPGFAQVHCDLDTRRSRISWDACGTSLRMEPKSSGCKV